ncbi:hypothetical protein GCM10009738_43970 [Kitasatospora viridis]
MPGQLRGRGAPGARAPVGGGALWCHASRLYVAESRTQGQLFAYSGVSLRQLRSVCGKHSCEC